MHVDCRCSLGAEPGDMVDVFKSCMFKVKQAVRLIKILQAASKILVLCHRM